MALGMILKGAVNMRRHGRITSATRILPLLLACLALGGRRPCLGEQPAPSAHATTRPTSDADYRSIRENFEAAAKILPVFDITAFLYGRGLANPLARFHAEASEAGLRAAGLWEAASGPWSSVPSGRFLAAMRRNVRLRADADKTVSVWVALLDHEDARVRTLALAALAVTGDPHVLPHVVRLTNDETPTFSTAAPVHMRLGDELKPPTLEARTVGQVARQILGFWAVPDPHDARAFEQYWAGRKDRQDTIGWIQVRLNRASGGSSSISDERIQAIYYVHTQIEQLPAIHSELAWLALDHPGQPDVKRQVLFAARRLGPQRLLALLKGDVLIDDPDVAPNLNRVRTNILSRATSLFDREHAEALEAAWRASRDRFRSPLWAIACAELDPGQATGLINQARQQDDLDLAAQAKLLAALWRIVGPAERTRVIEWFYEPVPAGRNRNRMPLIDLLFDRWNADDRRLLAILVADKRFDEWEARELEGLAQALNRSSLKPVVDPEELRNLRHPLGLDYVDRYPEKAMEKNPQETQALMDKLSHWRVAIRAEVATWSPAK